MRGLITKERTNTSFYGFYKGHELVIEKHKNDDYFYIQVYNDGGYAYDGYAPEECETVDDAIKEAIDGAQL